MTFGAILLLALGLAMDATAVSAAKGLAVPSLRARHVLLVAGFFGGFQALMPVLGWLLGARIGPLVQAWDHWIAFVLLACIGGKMLWEARSGNDGAGETTVDHFALRSMFDRCHGHANAFEVSFCMNELADDCSVVVIRR